MTLYIFCVFEYEDIGILKGVRGRSLEEARRILSREGYTDYILVETKPLLTKET